MLGSCASPTFKLEISSPTFNLQKILLKVYHFGTLYNIWGMQMLLGDNVRSQYTPLGGINAGTDAAWAPYAGEYLTQV